MYEADKWHKNLHQLQRLLREDNATVTRIATLDTGLNLDPDMADYYDGRAEAYCFLNDGPAPKLAQGDEDGHGTHVASIILDLGVSCRVYSARIAGRRQDFQDMKPSKDIPHRIAKVST
jgi:hypothetical protein